MERRLGLEALREILPDAPSSVGKQYSKYSAASASAPLLTTLGRPPLPRPAPLAVVPRLVICRRSPPEHLRLCISTLQAGQFGRQANTNSALTAAESLFWGISDAIQAKRHEADHEPPYSVLWVYLLLEILRLPPR
jgi:hypothetical protein